MDKYYYLAAQLPFLKFGHKPQITGESFLREAEKWLGRKEIAALRQADINDFSHAEKFSGILQAYKKFEKRLREELSIIRKAEGEGGHKIDDELKAALAGENPLDIEKRLLYLRWKFVDKKKAGHYFDWEFLTAYFFKIQILERLFVFDKDKGMAEFDKVCEAALNPDKGFL